MAPFDSGKRDVPIAFDVGTVGMELGFQPGFMKDPFTSRDIGRNRYADTDRNDTKIHYYLHGFFFSL
jgi:hypothetical protein